MIDEDNLVYSKPTMCLRCHVVVEMFHAPTEDPVTGGFHCPRCGHVFKFVHWIIKKRAKGK